MRLKTNIQPMTNSLDEIMKMRPVSYTLKSNGKDSMG
ncbi:tail fiber domain-containing protein, partial [Vibrio parahaemolyticus]